MSISQNNIITLRDFPRFERRERRFFSPLKVTQLLIVPVVWTTLPLWFRSQTTSAPLPSLSTLKDTKLKMTTTSNMRLLMLSASMAKCNLLVSKTFRLVSSCMPQRMYFLTWHLLPDSYEHLNSQSNCSWWTWRRPQMPWSLWHWGKRPTCCWLMESDMG